MNPHAHEDEEFRVKESVRLEYESPSSSRLFHLAALHCTGRPRNSAHAASGLVVEALGHIVDCGQTQGGPAAPSRRPPFHGYSITAGLLARLSVASLSPNGLWSSTVADAKFCKFSRGVATKPQRCFPSGVPGFDRDAPTTFFAQQRQHVRPIYLDKCMNAPWEVAEKETDIDVDLVTVVRWMAEGVFVSVGPA